MSAIKRYIEDTAETITQAYTKEIIPMFHSELGKMSVADRADIWEEMVYGLCDEKERTAIFGDLLNFFWDMPAGLEDKVMPITYKALTELMTLIEDETLIKEYGVSKPEDLICS